MEFTIKLTASPELLDALNNLASAFSGKQAESKNETALKVVKEPAVEPSSTQPRKRTTKNTQTEEAPAPEVQKEEATQAAETDQSEEAPTLEEIRELVVAKAREGFREEVKKAIQSFGVERVTDLDPAKYAELKAKVLTLKAA